jgi:hypothetical protein
MVQAYQPIDNREAEFVATLVPAFPTEFVRGLKAHGKAGRGVR